MARTNLVPLGSVVVLNNGVQKLMVIGRGLTVRRGGKEYFFDYAGVMYPEGITGAQVAYFNHTDINTVYFTGFNDDAGSDATELISKFIEDHPDLVRATAKEWNQTQPD